MTGTAPPTGRMSAERVRHLTRLSSASISRMVKSGEFPRGRRIGPNDFDYPEDDVLAWLVAEGLPTELSDRLALKAGQLPSLAHEERLEILKNLRDLGPGFREEIANRVHVDTARAKAHLSALRAMGMVDRTGKKVRTKGAYSRELIISPHLAELDDAGLWHAVLSGKRVL